MRAVLLPAALGALLAAAAARAEPLVCPDRLPRLRIAVVAPAPTLDRGNDRETLSRRAVDRPEGNVHTLGLYSALWNLTARREVTSLVESGGRDDRGCAWLDSVDIRIEMSPRVIHLARELAPRTCRYRAVLEHERKHVAVDDAVLAEGVETLRTRLPLSLSGLRTPQPVRLGELDALRRRFIAESEERINALWQELSDERNRRQRAVDSSEEYARVDAKCRR